MGYSPGLTPAKTIPISPETGYANTEAAIVGLIQQQQSNSDPDQRIAAIAPSALPYPLPSANRGEYYLFNSSGAITVNGSSYAINQGDRLWCNSDGTAEGDEVNWEALLLPTGNNTGLFFAQEKNSNFVAEVNGIYPVDTRLNGVTSTPPSVALQGDRFILFDSRATAGVNSITVDFVAAAAFFYGANQNYVLNENTAYTEFLFINSIIGWIVQK